MTGRGGPRRRGAVLSRPACCADDAGGGVQTASPPDEAATWSRRRILSLAACLSSSALAGCSSIALPHAAAEGPAVGFVDVVSRDWHTDIGLPVAELRGPLASLRRNFPGAAYLLFGFGERAYWTKADPTVLDMLRALVPGPGLILVTGLRVPPATAFGQESVVALAAPEVGLDRVSDFLWGELAKGPDGLPHPVADGPYLGSLFYATPRVYSAVYTCNTWTADAVRIAGLPMPVSGVLFAVQVMTRARAVARSEGSVPTATALR